MLQRAEEEPEAWVKPWTSIPPSPNNGEMKVQWPADTEDCGQVKNYILVTSFIFQCSVMFKININEMVRS